MVRKVAALSNLVCRILIHPASLPSYVIGLASLFLASRAPQTKNFLDSPAENQPLWKTQVGSATRKIDILQSTTYNYCHVLR